MLSQIYKITDADWLAFFVTEDDLLGNLLLTLPKVRAEQKKIKNSCVLLSGEASVAETSITKMIY